MTSSWSRHAVAVGVALAPALSGASDFETIYSGESRDSARESVVSHAKAFDEAAALEARGKAPQAHAAYVRAARAGDCNAAKRLGQIYDKGLLGVQKDFRESLKWYNFARALGTCDIGPLAQ